MTLYIFERTGGTLSVPNVKAIVKEAGYDPAALAYTQVDSKKVNATGAIVMAPSTLEHAAKKLGYKGTTVTVVDGVAEEAYSSSNRVIRSVAPSIGNLLGATDYGVTISMDQNTVAALSSGNYSLFGFKGVQTSAGGGVPLVWFKSDDFGLDTEVSWEVQYEAYTSRSAIIPNGQIKGLSSYAIDLGQMLEVETPQGTGSVVDGTEGMISIENLTTTQVTCGISEVVDGTAQPLCAFPLYGNGLDAIVPIQKVMFTFSTNTVNTGTVIEKAYSQSILIDLTAKTHREVSFDINEGWSWGGFSWAQAIRPSTNVVPLLIESNA
ncbi:hypothetical protein HGP16_31445 [Rhizobium sp. P40RR-XXII]|uniref:hypothetical protein n=1 Tax=unclassified Rhizobium TaxID=2613769 RepID=UPI0014566A2C|nr:MULTISPECIES: hypothetical protein [unclassified Rhizobium]NLR89165.1 hypothetical protein [Rhizobium sp. P28RR-XV]NLS21017.1 hypothetical protein [Rhizobium sp. P40RR-XXII]